MVVLEDLSFGLVFRICWNCYCGFLPFGVLIIIYFSFVFFFLWYLDTNDMWTFDDVLMNF
jgi:hypothetical protein